MERLPREDEINAWLERNMDRIPSDMAKKYYKLSVNRAFYETAEALGNIDLQAYQNLGHLLFTGMRLGVFDLDSDVNPAQFSSYMDEVYLPKARELHILTEEWFSERLRQYDYNLYMELTFMGANWGLTEYEGTDGSLRKFAVYHKDGYLLATIEYDPSHNVFYAFWADMG